MTKQKKESLFIFLIQWWSVGAVYFFIGWGTNLGQGSSTIDFVVFLGVIIGLVNSFIVNPILKSLYGYGPHKAWGEVNIPQRILRRIVDILTGIIICLIIFFIYQGINIGAINLFDLPEETVFLPGEPIIFSLFFTIINLLIKGISFKIKKANGSK